MPIFRNHTVFEVARGVKAFFSLDAGVTRGPVPGSQPQPPTANAEAQRLRKELGRVRKRLKGREDELGRLRSKVEQDNGDGDRPGGIKPENMVWVFGSGRTGSSWLTTMMGDLEGYARWNEPYVGEIFGMAYYVRVGDRMRGRKDYMLGDPYRETWIRSIRNFILEGADARYPKLGEDGTLVIKEPNGSAGAPLLVEALPESRVILLVREPRDVVSSSLAANKKGSWGNEWRADGTDAPSLADTDPDAFVRQAASIYAINLEKSREAYEAHEGPKVVVRYEDLRADTLATMRRILEALGLPTNENQLARVVDKHAWENVPDEQKGPDKPRRKARPGSWEEDLTPEQAETVEKITAPFLDGFYPGWASSAKADA